MNRFARSFRIRASLRSSSALRGELGADVQSFPVTGSTTPERIFWGIATCSAAALDVGKLAVPVSVKWGEFVASSAIGFNLAATAGSVVDGPAQSGHVCAFEDDSPASPQHAAARILEARVAVLAGLPRHAACFAARFRPVCPLDRCFVHWLRLSLKLFPGGLVARLRSFSRASRGSGHRDARVLDIKPLGLTALPEIE
jgi:hypothetical protein